MFTAEVPPVADHTRIDRFLAENHQELSRSIIQNWILEGRVRINGNVCLKNKTLLLTGQTVSCDIPDAPAPFKLTAETFNFPILYEDDAILVIDKPAGLVVHPAPGHSGGTLVNALLSHIPDFMNQAESEETERPGIVHRLDKETSGCLVVAKTASAHRNLTRAFAERKTMKTYLALTYRFPPQQSGHIENLIGRHSSCRQKMAIVTKNGREAITDYRVMARGLCADSQIALVEVDIHTGRTHQIRVHLASLRTPVLGDTVYGGKQPPIADRQMLHARSLTLIHPVTRKKMTFVAPIPDDFQMILDQTDWLPGAILPE